ncbi:sugar transferase [Herbiconiux sp. KACC 21604]|uniref:sugar transferase n=1 Tax=unclassified Herbiconiux TaxID=2618217 RepID=UPI001492AD1C|nr:sugar transferase [Herbiconiux sp. SALV-R1]QJU54588.1 sugar transferase [Herbiconiux sp. SALV-R1]WPO85674.1 sugar transferase [Herbiconiux sp. KACC 21604]
MTAETRRPETVVAEHDWRLAYSRRLALTDFVVIAIAVTATQVLWFGASADGVAFRGNLDFLAISYTVVSVILTVCWTAILGIYGSRSDRLVGTGTAEYRSVVDASLRIFGVLAIVAFLLKIDFSRGYFIVALPLGTLALLAARWGWRQWLNRRRARGEYSAQVLLVGSEVSVLHTATELARHPQAGYHVVGACVPSGRVADYIPGTNIPVAGSVDRVGFAIEATGADTIVITSSDELSPDKIRELSWSLEPGRQHLVVAPSLTDIGGPRIHTRPVAGLPLIHVETPRYEGFKRYQKRIFDIVASALLIVLSAPVLLTIAVVVRLSTPGPVLFKQERVGLNGSPFRMLKFRSMVTDADALIKDLEHSNRTEGNAVLFKMKDDPRVTAVGRVLRKFSLDELPQLFNVLRGDMSLIGPRPPLQREVDLYESHVHRRFLMKPGITGLWQVSGRSDLSWEDSVRLDLYYVENWSMVGDFIILLRTVRAVFASSGAY